MDITVAGPDSTKPIGHIVQVPTVSQVPRTVMGGAAAHARIVQLVFLLAAGGGVPKKVVNHAALPTVPLETTTK